MRSKGLAGIVAALVCATGAEAATIVDTGGNPNGNYWAFNNSQYFAGKFSTASDQSITEVSAYFATFAGGSVTATLFSDAANKVGEALYSQTFVVGSDNGKGWQGVSSLKWDVSAGSYWLAFAPDANVYGTWFGNAPSPLMEYAQHSSGQWQDFGDNGFDYLAVGLRVNAVSNPGAVPEPATWAMMIIGFGVVGYSMRARTKVRFASAI